MLIMANPTINWTISRMLACEVTHDYSIHSAQRVSQHGLFNKKESLCIAGRLVSVGLVGHPRKYDHVI